MQDFVVESEIELPQKFWETRNSSAPYWAMRTQIASLLFLLIHILYFGKFIIRNIHYKKVRCFRFVVNISKRGTAISFFITFVRNVSYKWNLTKLNTLDNHYLSFH